MNEYRYKYSVLAATTDKRVLDCQCDVDDGVDTIKEGRERVKLLFDPDYWCRCTENPNSEPLRYAQIVDEAGIVRHDFYARGYQGEPEPISCEKCGEIIPNGSASFHDGYWVGECCTPKSNDNKIDTKTT